MKDGEICWRILTTRFAHLHFGLLKTYNSLKKYYYIN